MPPTSLPAGDTVSPTALGSEAHTNTQHTVTGECVHNCGTSEAMAMKDTPILQNCSVLLPHLVLATGRGNVPLCGPVLIRAER